jgi:hypothetical protein
MVRLLENQTLDQQSQNAAKATKAILLIDIQKFRMFF